jgi:hypothetical protein
MIFNEALAERKWGRYPERGMAATSYPADAELNGFRDFDQAVRGLQNAEQLQARVAPL